MNRKIFGTNRSWPLKALLLRLPGWAEENHKILGTLTSVWAESLQGHLANMSKWPRQ